MKCFGFVCENLTTFPFGKRIVGKFDLWAFGDIFNFKIKVGVYEKLAKSSDCATRTYAASLAATSVFRTVLLLALAICTGLAHAVGRRWCGLYVFRRPCTFAVVIKPPRGRLSQRCGPLPKLKLLWADLYIVLLQQFIKGFFKETFVVATPDLQCSEQAKTVS